MVAKPIRKRLREPVDEENKNEKEPNKVNGKESAHKDEERMEFKKEKGKELECKKQKRDSKRDEKKKGKELESMKQKRDLKQDGKEKGKEMMQRRLARTQRKTRIRFEQSIGLKLTAMIADSQLLKIDSIKVQSEDGLFGYESYTYLPWDDFEAFFTLSELTGAVISSYMM